MAKRRKTIVWALEHFQDSGSVLDIQRKSFNRMFYAFRENYHMDIFTKRIALKAAPSVVCLKIFSGEEVIRCGSGFILECHAAGHNQFECIVITSATLLRVDHDSNCLLDNLKVVVVLSDGTQCCGELRAHDCHYNLAAIKVEVDHAIQISRLRHVDDSMPIEIPPQTFQLQPHSDVFKLVPGTQLISLGRYHDDKGSIMTAPGVFSIEQCRFDCKDLLRSTCLITKCGIGGPVINRNAEVIGVNFFALGFTPFLPSNIVSKWWDHFQKFKGYCRPSLGLELSNLYTTKVCSWEKIIQKFPYVKEGIVVDEVMPNSPASSANVLPGDIIIEFDGEAVRSCLQFFDQTWDKVGKPVKLVVIRRENSSRMELSVTTVDVCDSQFNRWPLPGSC